MGGDLLPVPSPAGVERALRAGAVVDAGGAPDVVGVLGDGVDGTGDGDTQRAGVDDDPRRDVDDALAGGAAHQVHRCGPVPAGYGGGEAHCEPGDAQLRPARRTAVDPDGGHRLRGVGRRVRGGVLLAVDEAGRMSGAGATSRIRIGTTGGVTTAWGRALHAELLKVMTLPADVLVGSGGGRGYGCHGHVDPAERGGWAGLWIRGDRSDVDAGGADRLRGGRCGRDGH